MDARGRIFTPSSTGVFSVAVALRLGLMIGYHLIVYSCRFYLVWSVCEVKKKNSHGDGIYYIPSPCDVFFLTFVFSAKVQECLHMFLS